MTQSICPITFLDPQPEPGDEDRLYFCISSDGLGLYAVTRTTCSCPWGTHHREDLLDKPCKHITHLLDLLGEPSCSTLSSTSSPPSSSPEASASPSTSSSGRSSSSDDDDWEVI